MKLFYCPACGDVVKMTVETRHCQCKTSSGKYLFDGLHAEIYGRAIPLGISNRSFDEAIRNQPADGSGRNFDAFVIPKQCDTVTRVGP